MLNSAYLVIYDIMHHCNRFFMKLFKTNNIDTLMICYSYFGVNLPSVILRNRAIKFEQKFAEVHKVVV